jgi:anti-anti-sigma factor
MASLLKFWPLDVTMVGDVTVVHFTGPKVSLDTLTTLHVGDELLALVDEPGGPDVVLDFGNVDCVCAAALGLLVRLHNRLGAVGRFLIVTDLCPQVFELFAVAGLDRYLQVRPARSFCHRWIDISPEKGV